jgi:hypothetical protein
MFSTKLLCEATAIAKKQAGHLLNNISSHAANGSPFDIQKALCVTNVRRVFFLLLVIFAV